MDTRCAEAQSSEAAVFPPQVILWGIQRGCDTDAASERRLIERLESYAGPPVRRMTVPSDPRLLNCVGVQCAQLVQDACPQLTGQLVGGEVDDRPGERRRLGAGPLVGAAEHAVQQVGTGAEHALVELGGDGGDAAGDDGRRGLDDGTGLLGEHRCSFRGRWLAI